MKKVVLISEPCRLAGCIADELGKKDVECVVVGKKELVDRDACERTASRIFEKGAADGVIYSALTAGDAFPRHIADMSVEEWKKYKDEAFRLPYDMYGTFIRKMTECGAGRYLYLTPLTGVLPAANGEASGGIGAAGIMMMQSAVFELGVKGFTGCAVAIGNISDDEASSSFKMTEELKKHEAADIEISSAEAASQIVSLFMDIHPAMTGGIFRIDAGLSCGYMREW